jgi:hypothetical protein
MKRTRAAASAEAPTLRYDNRPDASYPSVFRATLTGRRPFVKTMSRRLLARATSCRPLHGTFIRLSPVAVPSAASICRSALRACCLTRLSTSASSLPPSNSFSRRAWKPTRFHAAQGLALQLTIVGISLLFNFLRLFTGSSAGGFYLGSPPSSF